LPFTVGVEILELQEGLQAAQTAYLLTVASAQLDVRARAEYVLGELTAALEWLLDDGVEDERDQQLAALNARSRSAQSNGNLARRANCHGARCIAVRFQASPTDRTGDRQCLREAHARRCATSGRQNPKRWSTSCCIRHDVEC